MLKQLNSEEIETINRENIKRFLLKNQNNFNVVYIPYGHGEWEKTTMDRVVKNYINVLCRLKPSDIQILDFGIFTIYDNKKNIYDVVAKTNTDNLITNLYLKRYDIMHTFIPLKDIVDTNGKFCLDSNTNQAASGRIIRYTKFLNYWTNNLTEPCVCKVNNEIVCDGSRGERFLFNYDTVKATKEYPIGYRRNRGKGVLIEYSNYSSYIYKKKKNPYIVTDELTSC